MNPKTILETCACLAARREARRVTARYDEALRPSGLRITQFTVLAAAAGAEGKDSITTIAEMLGMDRSTLSRNLEPLLERGLLTLAGGGGRGGRTVELTPEGRTALENAVPLWAAAQNAS